MMVAKGKIIERKYIGSDFQEVCEMPNLIGVQTDSYERFLQTERMKKGEPLDPNYGLEAVFRNTFPIKSQNEEMTLNYDGYTLDFDNMKYTETECKKKSATYSVPVKARINLELKNGELREKEIFFGDIPLMTERGTFIVNGAERVVVSQIHRSPGVIFQREKGVYSSRIIPYRGSWLEFEIDEKRDIICAKIDRKKRILGTLFLRAIGVDTREKIVSAFYKSESVEFSEENREEVENRFAYKDIYGEEDGQTVKIVRAGDQLLAHTIDRLLAAGINSVEVVDMDGEGTLHSEMILNCLEFESTKYTREGEDEPTKEDYLGVIYDVLMPGEMISMERAERDLPEMFFTDRRYNLGAVGRYKFNKKFGNPDDENMNTDCTVLTPEDIVNTMGYLIKVYIREANIDDIDHLGNRRVRSVGELLQTQLSSAFSRMERIARERMNLEVAATVRPQDVISIKPVVAAIREFFGSSQLSQFMDQVNPLAELTHKRRLNALGPGGLSRDRAGFEVRDVHYTHYGRMCPIETPEGPNIGLIVSLANYTRINQYGFLETPYRKVVDGVATNVVKYLDATDEEKYFIGQASAKLDKDGHFLDQEVPVRHQGDYSTRRPEDIKYMDVSPKQVISVAASLIPFLEHDDANRALMGSNKQRQAVPLLFPESPRVGTGMERKTAYDSGVLVKAKRGGIVEYASASEVRVKVNPEECEFDGEVDTYEVQKFQRANQDTCLNQKTIVNVGQVVEKGTVLADGPATQNGELALGRNILVGFVPWNGYNYEDAVLISERVVREDIYTSIHISELSIDIRETKLGPEKLTRDIPNTSERMVAALDAEGIVTIGTYVRPGSILVGKVTPKSVSDSTPEFKLLNSIFGEKAKEVRDSSLKVPHGTEGTVIDIQRMKKSDNSELPAGVEEKITVLIATKRKLTQGDKMAGRHGNKGVVSRILPEEDMPYMEDGTPLDVCLNPLGVPSRMNIGQLMETQLGWAAVKLDEWYSSPVFQSASMEQIEAKMKEAGLPVSSKTTLRDGRTGIPFVNPVFCGYIYYLKLHHLVDDKMHARSTGPYSLVTQQPLGGKAQFGGQRLGEMEVWALEAYGAANNLQELLTIKSDDMNGRVKIYESIVKGDPAQPAGMPEAFNVLVQEIRGLALDMSVYDSDGKQVALTERDQQIINKKEKGSI